MKRNIEVILQERFGDPIGSYAGDAPVGVRSTEEKVCQNCGMQHTLIEDETCTASLGPCVGISRTEASVIEFCNHCGMMLLEGCGCTHLDEAEVCNQCGMIPLEGEGCGCTHVDEAKKKRPGLWANIHARRKAGKHRRKPGEKGYPETLDIEK